MAKIVGTIIKTWKYRVHGTGQEIPIPLRFAEQHQAYTFKQVSMFRVELVEPCPIKLENKDADILKKEAWKILDDYFAVEWKPFFEVTVVHYAGSRYSNQEANGRKITMEYREVDLGTRPNGDKLHRYPDRKTWIDKNWPEEGASSSGMSNDNPEHEMTSLIPNTPENREKLDGILKAMELLGKRMHDFLSPKNILTTLSKTRALPAPKKNMDGATMMAGLMGIPEE